MSQSIQNTVRDGIRTYLKNLQKDWEKLQFTIVFFPQPGGDPMATKLG